MFANKHEILNVFTEYFTAKYTTTESMLKPEECLHGLTLTKLNYEQTQQLDMSLSLQELISAIMNMEKKTPGSNGFAHPSLSGFG